MFRSKPQWKMVVQIHAFFMALSVQNNRHLFEEIFNRFRGTGHHAYPACKMSAHSVPAHLVSILISVIRHHYANFEEKKDFVGNRKASVAVICSSSVVLMVMQTNKLNLILGNESALNAVVWIKKSPDRF